MVTVRKKIIISIFVFMLFLSLTTKASYSGSQNQPSATTKEFGVFTGYASGDLKRQDDYNMIPLHLQFGFDITSALNKINIKPRGNLKFLFEPFLNTIISPDSNIEVGNNFLLKYSHPIAQKLSVYFEFGLGMMLTTQHTYEQGTQFNFSEQPGAGISYSFAKNKAINLGYRYRHFSNADIEEPNGGIDMDYFLCGISVFY